MSKNHFIKPEEGDSLLYKYRPLGTDEYRERVRDILVNHRLFAGAPTSMNDPFECKANWSYKASRKTKHRVAIERIQMMDPRVSKKEAKRRAPSRIRHFEKHGRDQIEKLLLEEVGFISFGGVRDNLLMWAHYAAEHRGVAIEFAATHISHYEFFGSAMRVTYQKELPTINAYTAVKFDKVRSMLLTKSEHWAYEKELRILVDNRQQNAFYNFPSNLISAIHVGCRASNDDVDFLKQCIQDGGLEAKLTRARQSESAYGIEFISVDR